MRILDVLTSPWAIHPEKLTEIRSIYQTHLHGPKIDWKAMKAQFGLMMSSEGDENYQVENGVAIIPVKGVLSKGLSLLAWLFGGSSMEQIGQDFQQALTDPEVTSILLDVDSPGGTVDGTEELANMIFNARGAKPIVAYCDGNMCSAAYWIASAADRIYISGDTIEVGSVGVLCSHIDQSEFDKMMGAKWTEITSGPYKRLASAHRPLSDKGASYLQEQVDYLAAIFTETALIRNRGLNEEQAVEISQAKTYYGKQAIEIGLVDGVSTYDDLIISAPAGVAAQNGNYSAKEESIVDINELKTKHPDVYAAALAEGKIVGAVEGETRGKAAGIDEGKAMGAAAERQRITDVRAQLIPGHEALIEQLAMDGKTTGPEAAAKVVAAEKALGVARLAALKDDGALGVAQPAAPDGAGEDAAAGKLSVEDQAKKDYAAKKDLRAEFVTEGAYVAYCKGVAEGKIKILGKK
jgi:capsid assembly protease